MSFQAVRQEYATAAVPGSCGELIQGVLDGRRLLVSCPVDHLVRARVWLGPGSTHGRHVPPGYEKAAKSLENTLRLRASAAIDAGFQIDNPLPRGIGMASSTADIVAVAAATLNALGEAAPTTLLARLAAAIEPSDSTLFPGLCLMDYRSGEVLENLGQPPPVGVLLLDWGGSVDTGHFNRRVDARGPAQSGAHFSEALALLRAATREQAPEALAEAARLSAIDHQRLLPRPHLDRVEKLARELGGFGCNIAHSGTLMGLLMPDDPHRLQWAAARVRRHLPALRGVRIHHLRGGGIA